MKKAAPKAKASRAKKPAPVPKTKAAPLPSIAVPLGPTLDGMLSAAAKHLGRTRAEVDAAVGRRLAGRAALQVEQVHRDGVDPAGWAHPWDSETARADMLAELFSAGSWWMTVASAHPLGSYGYVEAVAIARIMRALSRATTARDRAALEHLSNALRFSLKDLDPATTRADGVREALEWIRGWANGPTPVTVEEAAEYLVAHFMSPDDELRQEVRDLGRVPCLIRRDGAPAESVSETKIRVRALELRLADDLAQRAWSQARLDEELILRVALRAFGMTQKAIDSAIGAERMRQVRAAKKGDPVK